MGWSGNECGQRPKRMAALRRSRQEGNVTREAIAPDVRLRTPEGDGLRHKSWRGRGKLRTSARRVGDKGRLPESGPSLLSQVHRLHPLAASGCKLSTTAGRFERQRQRPAVTLRHACLLLRLLLDGELALAMPYPLTRVGRTRVLFPRSRSAFGARQVQRVL